MTSNVLDLLSLAVADLGGAPRPGQQKMATAVAEAIKKEHHLAVQAGTGTGKSLAYLIPSIAAAMDSEYPVIVSTATIALQRQLVERDLPRLAKALEPELPRPLEFAIQKGRGNYVCLNKVANAQTDSGVDEAEESLLDPSQLSATGAQVARLHEWAGETEDGDRDNLPQGVSDRAWRQVSVSSRECVGATRCPFGEQCFAERARARAADADVVVTNHALLAIDALVDAPVLPEHNTVIVDEAHELEDRITSVATAELSPTSIAVLAKRAAKLTVSGADVAGDELAEAGDRWTEALKAEAAASRSNDRFGTGIEGRWTSVPEGLQLPLAALRDAAWKTNRQVSGIPASEFANDSQKASERLAVIVATEELNDTCVRILNASRVGEGDGSEADERSGNNGGNNSGKNHGASEDAADLLGEDVVWYTADSGVRGPKHVVRVAPLSVADLLRQRLFGRNTVILTSATLALGGKFTSMLARWGLPKNTPTLDAGTPFDARSHGILYVARHLPPPGRDGASDESVDEAARLINAAGGRTLGLFSSRRAAEEMAENLRTVVPYDILLQGEDSMSTLVEKFRKNQSACLFGTLGLWQGVDVPGPSLSLVLIDRIPFPRPDDPLQQARQEAADQRGGSGFMEVAANHAALLMAQGAGRLLRSVDDRGVVAVLDQRLETKRYGAYIRRSMPDFWYTLKGDTVRGALRRLAAGS